MVRSVLILWLCIALTASECEICFRGKCLAPTQLKAGGEDIPSAASAIDLNSNILYVVRNGTLQAVHLDDNTVNTVPTKQSSRIALLRVDQVSGDVYYTYGGGSVFRYIPMSGETETINQRIGRRMWAHNSTLYWPGLAKGLSYIKGSSKKIVDTFKSVKVGSLVFDKSGNMYAETAGKVYKKKPNEAKTELTSLPYGLRVDGNGDVYLIDSKKHLIYLDSEQINAVGAFGVKSYNYISNFVFDKYNNIIAKSSSSFILFKYTSEQCTVTNTDGIPYITNLTSPKRQEAPNNEDIPHFGD